MFHICADGIILCCVPKVETMSILEVFHLSPIGGHHSAIHTAYKSCSVGITGLPSTKMLMILPSLVTILPKRRRNFKEVRATYESDIGD